MKSPKLTASLEHRIRCVLQDRHPAEGRILKLESLTDKGRWCLVFGCSWESGRQDIVRYISNPLTVLKLLRIFSLLAPLSLHFPQLKESRFYPRLRGWLILEERLPGIQLGYLEPTLKTVEGVAEVLAKLHQVTSPHWSRTGYLPHLGSYYGYCYGRWIRRRLRRWFHNTPSLSRAVQKEYKAWFGRFRPQIDKITRFNLLHWDPNLRNYLYQDGQVRTVDFEFARFGVFWEDYFLAEFRFAGEDKDLQQAYQQRYFEIFQDQEMELKQQSRDFFQAFIYLRILNRLHGPSHRINNPKFDEQRYTRYERRFRELVEENN